MDVYDEPKVRFLSVSSLRTPKFKIYFDEIKIKSVKVDK